MPDKNLQGFFFILIRLCDIRGRKLHEWILAEARELIARCRTIADPRFILERPFEMPQHHKIIETPGLIAEIPNESRSFPGTVVGLRHSGCRVPMRVGHRMI